MEASESVWDYNCPMFVDFSEPPTEDDGADEWFDIHHEEEQTIHMMKGMFTLNKENQFVVCSSQDQLKPKRTSVEIKLRAKRVSIGDKKTVRRSAPMRVLKTSSSENCLTEEVSKKIKEMNLKTAPVISGLTRKNSVRKLLPQNENKKPVAEQVEQEKHFIESLRNYDEKKPTKSSNDARLLMTKPQPFKLTESKKEKAKPTVFRSMAEQLVAYQKQTPVRFRVSRRRSSNFKAQFAKCTQPRATIPITPNLQTKQRSRPTTAVSRDEQEARALAEIKKQDIKHQFKHRPVDPKILKEKPQLKKVEVKPSTKPKPFKLSENVPKVRRSASLDTIKTEFHAKPVPSGLFEGPKGLGSFKEIPLTTPKSPAFALKSQPVKRRSLSADGNFSAPLAMKIQPKLNSSKHSATNGIPNIKREPKITTVKPFSFDDFDRERFAKRDEKIKELLELERKKAEFHANPMPDLSMVKVPEKQVRPPTEIQPFKLSKNPAGTDHGDKFKVEKEKELERQREIAQFKARPSKVTTAQPFIPKPSNKKLTNMDDFELHTKLRSLEREDFDEKLRMKELWIASIRKKREEELQEEERQRLLQMRKTAVHKANPVRQYKPVEVKPSTTPLTCPMTPNFKSKTNQTSKF